MSRTGHHIIIPAVQRANYAGYVLSNGVKCVIVQDPNAKMPAAAMSVRAGQLNDPADLPGLAHFCEHMLFMGTEKFPKEDEFDSFVSKASGFDNAFTADRNTVYYFRVSDGGLEGALERFVEFFAAPNFSPGAVAREVNAVHSEDEKNHNNDFWRLDELIRGFYNPKHPRSRYGNGNHATLRDEPQAKGIDVRESLKAFHEKYYLAEATTFAAVSTRPPEEVLRLIEGPLSHMKRGAAPHFTFLDTKEPLFTPAALGTWTNLRTVRQTRELRVMWPVRSPSSKWRSTPSAYISHILGHECDTSILGVLKKRNWATSMVAGAHRVDDDFEIFDASVTLTLVGFQHLLEVVDLLYHGIGQSVAGGVDAAVYTKMKAEERLFFESTDVGAAEEHCVSLAENANETDLEHCWVGGAVILEDDLEATLVYVRQMTPTNSAVVLQWGDMPTNANNESTALVEEDEGEEEEGSEEEEGGEEGSEEVESEEEGLEEEAETATAEELFAALPDFAKVRASQVTRFHGAVYNTVRVPELEVARWEAAIVGPYPEGLALPSANPFIADDFTIHPPSAAPAVELVTSDHAVTYIRKDEGRHDTFKTALRCNVLSSVAYASPLHRLYTRVMHGILSNAITEMAYYATLASLSNHILFSATGLGVAVEGPSQKLYEFFFVVVTKALSVSVLQGTAEEFATYLEAGIRRLKNVGMGQPYNVVMQVQHKAVHCVDYLFNEMLTCEAEANYEGYKAFVQQYVSGGLLLECFLAGNILSTEDTKKVFIEPLEALLTMLTIPVPAAMSMPRVRDTFAPGHALRSHGDTTISQFDALSMPPFNPSDPNIAVVLDVPIGESTPAVAALNMTAMKLLSSLFFNALRTRESLGYVVFAQVSRSHFTDHALFVVQSALPDVDCMYLLSRIVAFLAAVEAQLDTLCTDAELQTVRAGLIAALEKVPDSVEDDARCLEGEYLSQLQFERRQRTIDALRATTVDTVKTFFQGYLLNSRTESRALVLCVNNTRTAGSDVLAQPGTRRILLPPLRTTKAEGEAATESAPAEEASVTLPTFEDGTSGVEVTTFASVAEYQLGLPVVRSTTY